MTKLYISHHAKIRLKARKIDFKRVLLAWKHGRVVNQPVGRFPVIRACLKRVIRGGGLYLITIGNKLITAFEDKEYKTKL